MSNPVSMVEVFRGEILESEHLGHAVVVNGGGDIVHAWGDPGKTVFPRSSSKILQAIPLLESGAGRDLAPEQLALACASHRAEKRHVDIVSNWLDDLGLDEHALCCGPQASRDEALRVQMIREGKPVTRAYNFCSGKHAGFLTLARHLSASLDYVDLDHPVQKSVKDAFEDMCGEDSPGHGIDGCSAPNFATSLIGLARAMAKISVAGKSGGARNQAAATLRDAMIAHPEMVAGEGKACTELMRSVSSPAVVKTGAEGIYVAVLPTLELGVALKIADGGDRASQIAIAAILAKLGVLDPANPYLDRPVKNWDGLVTGSMRPTAVFQ